MKKLSVLSLLSLSGLVSAAFGPGGPGPNQPRLPIDTNEIILIVAAVLLTVAVIAYKKLSVKKA